MEKKTETKMTILDAMSTVITKAARKNGDDYEFNQGYAEDCRDSLAYLKKMLGVKEESALLFSTIVELGSRSRGLSDVASRLGLTYTKTIGMEGSLNALMSAGLIRYCKRSGHITVPDYVIDALKTNVKYKAPAFEKLDTRDLLDRIDDLFDAQEDNDIDNRTMWEEIMKLIKHNPDNMFVMSCRSHGLLRGDSITDNEKLFLILVHLYISEDDDEVRWWQIQEVLKYEGRIYDRLKREFNSDFLWLLTTHIIEPCNTDGMADKSSMHITDEVKNDIFAEIGGACSPSSVKVMLHSSITAKELYFDGEEAGQLARLYSLLDENNYKDTCRRLKESGLRTGFSCLFYGDPGTGKTESVYQLAKRTGRDIIPVNVTEIKSKWVGDSEKQMKQLFYNYRLAVKRSDKAPILLFNEADAIFGIRKEGADGAVDKMENSIQNILLQEMENLDGIMIATTNLTQNLDKAFERRFLYKVRFRKPSATVKAKIWKSMLPDLSDEQSCTLAEGFEFSGGQIENITRKRIIQGIIDGAQPGFSDILAYCSEENIKGCRKEGRRIGF